jgi:hypothetical protein
MIGRLNREERGSALALVLLVGSTLVLLTAIVVTRSNRLVGNSESDSQWDQSLHVAEGCIDVALAQLGGDDSWNTGETLPSGLVGASDERTWVVTAAAGRSDQSLTATPEGECIAIRPAGEMVLYGVGYVPARGADGERIRVVRVLLEMEPTQVPYAIDYAFVTNDDLHINLNPTSVGSSASIHANGGLHGTGNITLNDACLTSSDGSSLSGTVNVHGLCPVSPYDVDEVEIPEIVAREFWEFSEYDMCRDGKVRAGPAHVTHGATVVAATPCTGSVLEENAVSSPYRGWTFDGCCDAVEGAQWSYNTNTKYDGAYFFYGGTARVVASPGTNLNPWRVLLVTEARFVCPTQEAGDFYMLGNSVVAPYTLGTVHADNTAIVIAGRDIQWSGQGRFKAPGIVAAAEQIRVDGNPAMEGTLIAEGWCDSPGDNLDTNEIAGNPTFTLDAALDTIWVSENGPPIPTIIDWAEL